jgi:hypothetical protein
MKAVKLQACTTARRFSRTACACEMMKIYEQLQHQEFLHDEITVNAWTKLRERMKAEWELFKNLLEASEAAMHEKMLTR